MRRAGRPKIPLGKEAARWVHYHPRPWRMWVEIGVYRPLAAERGPTLEEGPNNSRRPPRSRGAVSRLRARRSTLRHLRVSLSWMRLVASARQHLARFLRRGRRWTDRMSGAPVAGLHRRQVAVWRYWSESLAATSPGRRDRARRTWRPNDRARRRDASDHTALLARPGRQPPDRRDRWQRDYPLRTTPATARAGIER
jgi:hypothetical protein